MIHWSAANNIGGDNVYDCLKSTMRDMTVERLLSELAPPVLLVHKDEEIDADRRAEVSRVVNDSLVVVHHLATALVLNAEQPRYASVVATMCPADAPELAMLAEACEKTVSFAEAEEMAASLTVSQEKLGKYREVFYAEAYKSTLELIKEDIENAFEDALGESGTYVRMERADPFMGLASKPASLECDYGRVYATLHWKMTRSANLADVRVLDELRNGWESALCRVTPEMMRNLSAGRVVNLKALMEALCLPQDAREMVACGVPISDIMA